MTKLLFTYVRRHLAHLLIVLILTLTISYLIMVSFDKKDREIYKNIILRDVNALKSNYELYERDDKISISSSQFKKRSQVKDIKVILIWSPLFKEWNFLTLGMDAFKETKCSETKCEITADRKRLSESDAILFHIRTLSMLDLPRNRTPRQKWIFFSLEAPPYSVFQGFEFMTNMFNWTMSYRRDSDVVIPYGHIVHQSKNRWNIGDLYRNWQHKTKMAVWMVSHCDTDGNREKYINQLRTFVDIDTYGGCGLASCPLNKTDLCIERFSKQYYFFLAFENAICDDYITEKLFRTLQYDMIPIVFGGGNYSSVAPSHSYIDALHFSTPKQLAGQMFQVASNFTKFSGYFQWRSGGYSVDTPDHCELCRKLHSENYEKYSIYDDINYWWIKNSNCKRWKSGSIT